MPIKICTNTASYTLANGERRKYTTTRQYEVKGPKWTPEQIAEMCHLVDIGVKKSRIIRDFKISRTTLDKYLLKGAH